MSFLARMLDRPGTVPLRRWLVQVHLWVGLAAGVLISVLGLSGSLIVFRQEIYRTANESLMRVQPIGSPRPLEQQADQVLRAHPGSTIEFIELPQDASSTTRFLVLSKDREDGRNSSVYVNPYTAEILGSNPRDLRWLDWLVNLHHNLLAGRTGRLIEGVVSVLFLSLCLTGIFIWWPGRLHWKRNLKVNPALRGWSLALGLHKAIGFWTLLILAMFAVTGISFTWNISKFVYSITRSSPQKMAPLETYWKSGNALLPLDEYLEKAAAAIPTGEAVFVNLPVERGRFVYVSVRLPMDLEREGAQNSVVLDPLTGAVLRISLLSHAPLGQRVLSSFGALHFGRFGFGPIRGLPVKIVWAIVGLTPGTLFFTGLLPWWNRVIKRRWAERDS